MGYIINPIMILICFSVMQYYLISEIRKIEYACPTEEVTIIYEAFPEYISATITAYTNRPEETNDCELTAIMEKPVVGWTVAVSHDLMHWLGGRVYIEGLGVRKVNDLMNRRFKKSVDIVMGTVVEAREFGKQERIVVYLGK